jgi:hypothetical protein
MRRLPFLSFVNQAVPSDLLSVNSGSSPWFKPIRVGIEGPNMSKSSIPTLLRLPLAMASARLTGQAFEVALSFLQGGTNLRPCSSQLLPSRSRRRQSFLHLGWGVSVGVRHVWVSPVVLYACGANPMNREELLSSRRTLVTIIRRCSPEDFHVEGRGTREIFVSI